MGKFNISVDNENSKCEMIVDLVCKTIKKLKSWRFHNVPNTRKSRCLRYTVYERLHLKTNLLGLDKFGIHNIKNASELYIRPKEITRRIGFAWKTKGKIFPKQNESHLAWNYAQRISDKSADSAAKSIVDVTERSAYF